MAAAGISVKSGEAADGWGSLKSRFFIKPKSEPDAKHLWDSAAPELVVEFCRHHLGSFGKLKAKLLKCQPEWIEGFLEHGGLLIIFDSLDALSKKGLGSFMDAVKQLECIQCIRAIMNNGGGLRFIIHSEETQQSFAVQISKSLDTENVLLKVQILELLSSLCIYSYEGYETTVRTLQQVQNLRGLPYTFSSVINELKHAEQNDYQIMLITFINCLIVSLEELEERDEVRHEFIALGILDILDKLRHTDNSDLQTQLDSFRDTHNEDLEALDQEANSLDLDIESPNQLVTRISKNLIGTQSHNHLAHILQSLLLIDQSQSCKGVDGKWRQLDNALSSVIISYLNEKEDLPEFEEKSLIKRALKHSLKGLSVQHPDIDIEEEAKRQATPIEKIEAETQTEIAWEKVAVVHSDKPGRPSVDTAPKLEDKQVIKTQEKEMAPKDYKYPDPPPNLPELEGIMEKTGIPEPPPNMPGVEDLSSEDTRIPRPPPNMPGVTAEEECGDQRIPRPPPNMPGVKGEEESGDSRIPKPPPNVPGVKTSGGSREAPNKIKSAPAVLQKPSCKMRTLKWDKITERDIKKKTGTLWNQIDLNQFALDVETMSIVQEYYSVKEPQKTTSNKAKEKKEKTSFLDQRAGMNISIFLKQFKHENLTKIIKEGNECKVSLEQMKAFSKLLPEVSVVKQIRGYEGELSELAEADLFFFEFLKLESYEMRVHILTTKLDYSSEYEEIKPNLEKLEVSCKEIINNEFLKTIMGILLSLGNFLNHGSYAGSAAGFRISSLNKLNDTRANKPRMTLLNSLVEIVVDKYPNLSAFGESMHTLEGSLRLSIDQLKDALNSLKTKIDQTCRKKLKFSEDLKEQVTRFLDLVTPQIEELERQAKHVVDMSSQICQFFAEEPSKFKLEDFMKTLHQFRKDFDNALKDNISRKEAEERKKRIEEKKKNVKNPNLRALGNSSSKQAEEGDIIEKLMGEIKRGMTLKTASLCRENSAQVDPILRGASERRKRASQRKRSSSTNKASVSSQESSTPSRAINEISKKNPGGTAALSGETVENISVENISENKAEYSEKNKPPQPISEEQIADDAIKESAIKRDNNQLVKLGNGFSDLDLHSKTNTNEQDERKVKSCENLLEVEVEPVEGATNFQKAPKKKWSSKSSNNNEKSKVKASSKESSGWKLLKFRKKKEIS